MGSDQLVVFISSSMEELAVERKAIWSAMKKTEAFAPFAWELDAGARTKSAQAAWREELEKTDICVALMWKKVGQWTKDELEIATELRVPLLVYVKTDDAGKVKKSLGEFLDEFEDPETGSFASGRFATTKRLKKLVRRDLLRVIKENFRELRERRLRDREQVTGSGRKLEPTEADHGWRSEEERGPKIGRRAPDDVHRLARHDGAFIDRVAHLDKVRRALKDGERIVPISGNAGMGKKAILRKLTDDAGLAERYRDGAGVNPEQSEGENVQDLLQTIWEEFFDPEELGAVEPRKQRRQLAGIEALIFFVDLELPRNKFDELLEAMPNSAFVVALRSRDGWPGKHVDLKGFVDSQDMLDLFEARYHGTIPQQARADVLELCEGLGGSPSLIGFLADKAWEEAEDVDAPGDADGVAGHPLIEWSAAHAGKAKEQIAASLVSPQAKAPITVGRAVGVHVPHTVMADTAGSEEAIDEGLADRFLEAASPRYRVNRALAEALGDQAEDPVLMGAILESAVDWADHADADEIFADRAFVVRMIEWAAGEERWKEVLRLARASEAAMALGGRWGAWQLVLEHALDAARRLDPIDEPSEAWALHQLGSRALVMDELGEARMRLHGALDRREALREPKAAALTAHSLGLVPLAVASMLSLLVALLGFAGWMAITLLGPSWLTVAIADIDEEVMVFETAGTQKITLTNVGTLEFTVSDVVIPSGDVFTIDDECSTNLLGQGDTCTVTVTANATADIARAQVLFTYDPDVDGDSNVLLRSAPSEQP